MEKTFIDFEMSSTDSHIKFNTIGELENNKIRFVDKELNKHYIVCHKNTIEYYKLGSMDMKFVFDKFNVSVGTYRVDNNTFKFDILTSKLENTSNGLFIEYKLFQDNEIVNESKLNIKYSVTEEEFECKA